MNKEIVTLRDKNNNFLDDIKNLNLKVKSLTDELNELKAMNNNMLTSIETLTEENNLLTKNLKKANCDVFTLKEVFNVSRKSVSTQSGHHPFNSEEISVSPPKNN